MREPLCWCPNIIWISHNSHLNERNCHLFRATREFLRSLLSNVVDVGGWAEYALFFSLSLFRVRNLNGEILTVVLSLFRSCCRMFLRINEKFQMNGEKFWLNFEFSMVFRIFFFASSIHFYSFLTDARDTCSRKTKRQEIIKWKLFAFFWFKTSNLNVGT